ncbi:MAG: hypothetical protein LBV69_06025 [Bacteroidales bacterium]|nr:hypothetical protein [Bacteroidales bacterium]
MNKNFNYKKIFRYLYFIIGIFSANNISAQKFKENDYFIECGLSYGMALYHPEGSVYLKDFYYPRAEIRFGKQSIGENQWEKMLNFPKYGVTLRYTSYWDFLDTQSEWKERNKVLGQSIAAFGYFQGTIIRYKWFSWNYQLGMGAAYFTKIYKSDVYYKPDNTIVDNYENRVERGMSVDEYVLNWENPNNYLSPNKDGSWSSNEYMTERNHNCLISLHVTPYINLQSGFDFKLTNQLDLSLQACFNHASNASMNMPNYGINEVQAIASIRYHFNPGKEIVKLDSFPKHKQLNSLFFTIDPGWLIARYDNNYWLKAGTSIGYMRKILPILNIGASFEFCYVRYLSHSKDYNYDEWEKENSERIKMPHNFHTEAFYAFTELIFGRFAFHVGVGAYIAKGPGQARIMDLAQNWDGGGTLKRYPPVYEKVGLRIYLGKNQNHFVGASIRAHFPVADYLAFTYGYKFFNFNDVKRR